MKIRSILVLSLLFAACNQKTPAPAPAQAPPTTETAAGAEASVPRISPQELQKRLPTVVVIDVRAADNYLFAHIPGAMHIPLAYIEQEAQYLPKDKPIVTYCT